MLYMYIRTGTHCKPIASASRWAIFTILWTLALSLFFAKERSEKIFSFFLVALSLFLSFARQSPHFIYPDSLSYILSSRYASACK